MSKRALCVGINNYPGTENDLSGCVNDATDWSKILVDRGFDVIHLLDAKAKKATLLKCLEAMVRSTLPGDVAVFTYSGHGTWVPDQDGDEADGRDEALCPHDIDTKGPLLDDELCDLFGQVKRGGRLVFLSDSCHSGTVARFLGKPEPSAPRVRFLPPAHFLGANTPDRTLARSLERAPLRSKAKRTALTLSGCQDMEFSFDASFQGRPNGAFTFAAKKALASSRIGPDSTYADWFKEIRHNLPSAQYPQRPALTITAAQRAWKLFALRARGGRLGLPPHKARSQGDDAHDCPTDRQSLVAADPVFVVLLLQQVVGAAYPLLQPLIIAAAVHGRVEDAADLDALVATGNKRGGQLVAGRARGVDPLGGRRLHGESWSEGRGHRGYEGDLPRGRGEQRLGRDGGGEHGGYPILTDPRRVQAGGGSVMAVARQTPWAQASSSASEPRKRFMSR